MPPEAHDAANRAPREAGGQAGRTMRICFIGDSFVNGTGDRDHLGWTARVCAAAGRRGHDVTGYNLGVRRETSADVASRWRRETACRLPAEHDGRVVFSFGVNDTTAEGDGARVAPADSVANLRALLRAARRLYPVLFVGPPPVADRRQNARIAALSAAFAETCRSEAVPCLAVFPLLADSETWRRETASGDGSHPSAPGYAELARLVDGWDAWRAWLP